MAGKTPAEQPIAPLLLSEIHAARSLGMSPSTLRVLRRKGKIDYVRAGKMIRYSPEQLKRFIAAQEVRHG